MISEVLGGQNPEVCVIGAIHGDEPCGYNAIEKVKENYKNNFNKPVKFIIANQKALHSDRRYIDKDLNRCFPGDINSNKHEEKLAFKIKEELENIDNVIALHSTRSTNNPFAITREISELELFKHFPLKRLVIDCKEGTLNSLDDKYIEIECGYQKSKDAEENALLFIESFLSYYGVIDYKNYPKSDFELFKLEEKIDKNGQVVALAQNFSPVEKGEIYAISKDKKYTADEKFYPVLMSSNGYKNIVGYKAKRFLKCHLKRN